MHDMAEVTRAAQPEDLHQAMVEGSTDLLLVLDGTGGIRAASPSAMRALTCRRSELLGRSLLEIVHPDDVPTAISMLGAAIERGGDSVRADLRVRPASADWRQFEILARAVAGPERSPLVVLNARDVSEHQPEPAPLALRAEVIDQLAAGFEPVRPRGRSPVDPTPTPTRAERPIARGETVLVALDERPLSMLASRILADLGYHILEASGPSDAEGYARVHRGEIHLLVADLATPRVRGRELVRLLRTLRPALRSLYVSSQPYGSLAERRVYESGARLLHVPFTPEELAHAVRAALDTEPVTPGPWPAGSGATGTS